MKRFASIDIGTNSVLLLVVERDTDEGKLVAVEQRATITRLGEGVDRTGELAAAATERTLACLADYAERIARLGVERVEVVATSAMRDARGGPDFASEVEGVLGTRPRIIAGSEEAELTFVGAISGLSLDSASLGVFDIGGGSTELIRADRVTDEYTIAEAVSLDIGSVRLHERCLANDPPTHAEYLELREVVRENLAAMPQFGDSPRLIGVAGTVTTLAALQMGLSSYDGETVHGSFMPIGELSDLRARLWSMSLKERKALPGLQPMRADVIIAGAVIAEEIVLAAGAEGVTVSDRGVRWGLAERAL